MVILLGWAIGDDHDPIVDQCRSRAKSRKDVPRALPKVAAAGHREIKRISLRPSGGGVLEGFEVAKSMFDTPRVCDTIHKLRGVAGSDSAMRSRPTEILAVWDSAMTLEDVLAAIEGKAISRGIDLSMPVEMACGADLMSDVLAFTHAGTLLLTGLTNPQVVRTAEMAGIQAVVFVRGKYPPPETVALAEEKGIPLLASRYTMYETCGRLYQTGLPGCGTFDLAADSWRQAFGEETD